MAKPYYITTPIYYVNSVPHAGHALTMIVGDAEKRFHQMKGEPVLYVTGTDENGLKVKEAAEKANEDPHAFVQKISRTFSENWTTLNIACDDFIRTTEDRHAKAVQRMFEILRDNGYMYEDAYSGWYDVSAETFVREADLVDGRSPDGNEVTWVEERNWFFKLSAFEQPLLDHIEKNPDFLLPEVRKNEVVSFIKQGLRDICATRANPGWGIPVPGDDSRVIYVWFDALINYIAATGWPEAGAEAWPADVHWMAKEIFTRFHATLWPAMLMGCGLPLPKTVIAHGWFTFKNTKMSKSLHNFVTIDEGIAVARDAGAAEPLAVDAFRWSLARSVPYESDTEFSTDVIAKLYNSDLANDLGNALNRSVAMTHKFVGGIVPDAQPEPEILAAIAAQKEAVEKAFARHRINEAAEAAITLARRLNKYIDDRAPWALAKAEDPALGAVLKSMLLCLRACEGLVRPFIPSTADAIAAQLARPALTDWNAIGDPADLPGGTTLPAPTPLFPRIDLNKKMDTSEPTPAVQPEPKPAKKPKGLPEPAPEVSIDEFFRLDLRVARIIEAERVEGSDKLMKLQVQVGDTDRQIVAGIAKQYAPEDLIGRQVVVVFNLKPAKLMGLDSQGMVMAADGPDGGAILLEPDKEAPAGSRVH